MNKFIYGFLGIMILLILTSCSGSNYETAIDNNVVLGNQESGVILTEYFDYQCPACANFHRGTLQSIKSKLIDTNRIGFKLVDFPLRSIHPNAQYAAEASYCAYEQDKYTEFQDFLYENQRNLGKSTYLQGAKELGLNTVKFEECINARGYKKLVDSGYNEAQRMGVNSTPTLLVNNIHVPNQNNFAEIETFVVALETPENETLLKDAFRNAIENNAKLALARSVPDLDLDTINLQISNEALNSLVNATGEAGDPIVSINSIVNEEVKKVIETLVGN